MPSRCMTCSAMPRPICLESHCTPSSVGLMQRQLLVIGDLTREEFQPVAGALRQRSDRVVVHRVQSIGDALRQGGGCDAIDAIWLAPSYRDEFSPVCVRELMRRFPLSGLTILIGSWLEGETRSGDAWLGAQRWYVDRVVPQWVAHRVVGDWLDLLVTVSDDECWLREVGRPWPSLSGVTVVCSEIPDNRDYMRDLCQQAGLTVVSQSPEDSTESIAAGLIVYDAVADRHRQLDHIAGLIRRYPRARLTVLASFPRWDESAAYLAAGATHVLGKPFHVSDLLWCLADQSLARVADSAA